jgi:hypothetical protein
MRVIADMRKVSTYKDQALIFIREAETFTKEKDRKVKIQQAIQLLALALAYEFKDEIPVRKSRKKEELTEAHVKHENY